MLANGDADGRDSSHTIANEKTALLECGRYMDALQLTIGDVISALWIGVILVAANPRRAVPPS